MDKALGYLGLARRGNNVAIGEEPVGAACRAGHGRLLVLASDAADHSCRRAKSFAAFGKPPIVKVSFTKAQLGDALGCNACAMVVFLDVELALAFARSLENPSQELLDTLSHQVERVQKRRKEEKAHRDNLRQGKRKHKKQ